MITSVKKKRKLNPQLLPEKDARSLDWLKLRLRENKSSKVAVSLVKGLHDEELGFEASSQTLGRLIKYHFEGKIKKQQDSRKQHHYYGLEISTQTSSTVVKSNQRCIMANETARIQTTQNNKVARRALNLYRSERIEKNATIQALSSLQAKDKFQRGLTLPNSLYLHAKELSSTEHEYLPKQGKSVSKYMQGSYGSYIKKTYRGMNVAVKMFHHSTEKGELSDNKVSKLVLQEANVLLNLRSSTGVPKLIGVILDEKPFSLVTSYHGMTSVADASTTIKYLLDHGLIRLTLDNWIKVIHNTASVLNHIHMSGYIHNDLKTNNVIVNDTFDVTLIDFGKSCLISKSVLHNLSAQERVSYKSLYKWIDPLVIDDKCVPSPYSDIYAFGCLVKTIISLTNFKSKRLKVIIEGSMDENTTNRFSLTRIENVLDGYV